MSWTDKLKPCPFCGGEARIDKGHSRLVEWYAVSCSKCRASQNVCYIKPEKAIEAWNTRADVPETNVGKIRAKAIDEFVDKAYEMLGVEDEDIYCKETIDEIAEQLRKGGVRDD